MLRLYHQDNFSYQEMLDYLLDILFPLPNPIKGLSTKDLPQYLMAKSGPINNLSPWIYCGYSYQDTEIRKIIFHLKKRRDRDTVSAISLRLHDLLTEIESEKYNMDGCTKTILVPIPLHQKSKIKRGFNQSKLLAEALAQQSPDRTVSEYLRCIKAHPKQAMLNRQARLKNVQGIFAIEKPPLVANTLIVIIDDVTTTEATLVEARNTLAEVIPKENIIALTIAH